MAFSFFILTVSFGSIFQTESDGEHGVIFKELCGEGIPPEIVTVLKQDEETFLYFNSFQIGETNYSIVTLQCNSNQAYYSVVDMRKIWKRKLKNRSFG